MNGLNQRKGTYMDKLNPAVREGIRRSFAELDVQAPDFEEKAINMIEQFLELQFKGIIKEWKKDNAVKDKQEKIHRTEIFDRIVQELLTEFTETVTKANENQGLGKDNIDMFSIKNHFSLEFYGIQVKQLIRQIDTDIYIDYLKYRMDSKKRGIDKEKADLDVEKESLEKDRHKIAEITEQLKMAEKHLKMYENMKNEGETNEDALAKAIENSKKVQDVLTQILGLTEEKERVQREKIEKMDLLYQVHLQEKTIEEEDIKKEIEELRGYEENFEKEDERDNGINEEDFEKEDERDNGINEEDLKVEEEIVDSMDEYNDEVSKDLEETVSGQEINPSTLEEEVVETEIKPSVRQIYNILERARRAATPEEFTKISTELARPYIKIRGNIEQKNAMEKLLGTFPEGINMLKVGLFQINTRKKYMQLTGKENPSKEEQEVIRNMKDKTRVQVKRILQERFPGQEIDVPPLRTEKEYIAELKDLEFKNLREDRNDQDIMTQITKMYPELSQVVSEAKQDKIQKIYNRIIRSLKGRTGVDNNKLPPTLKEFVVQKVKTPLPNPNNAFLHKGNRQQKQGDDIGEGGPSIE